MDILKLEYFISVAKYLNFTKAAEEHHIAQTAMSRQIANLEEELGVTLFYRSNRKVELTPAGEILCSEAVNFLHHFERAISIVKHTYEKKTGLLKIGIGTYDRYLATDVIKQFSSTHPQIEITIDQYDYRALSDELVQGHLDVVFCIDKYTNICEDITTIKLYEKPWCLAANVKHPWASKKTVNIQEMQKQSIITMNDGSQEESRNTPFEALALFNETVQVNSLDAKILALESNLGIALMPPFIKNISPKIKMITTDPPVVPRAFVAAFNKNNHNPSAKLFLNDLNNAIKAKHAH